MLRVLLSIGALLVAVLVAGIGAGVAVAEPDDGGATGGSTGGTGNTSETGESSNPPDVSEPIVVEPQPTTTVTPARPPSIFDIPRNIANQLRDMLGRPLSIFGNGRVPGTHTAPDTSLPAAATTGRKRDKDAVKQPEPTVPKPAVNPEPTQQPPPRRTNSSVDVTMPFSAPPISVPVPNLPVPGYESMRWKLDLSDPYAAYTSVGETLRTVNALLSDAYANPFKPTPTPAPTPRTTFRVTEEEPVLDAGGSVAAVPLAGGSDSLPVQVPVLIPPIRLAPSRPITGSVPAAGASPAGAGPQEVGAGPAGMRAPGVRDSVPQPGATPTGQLPPNPSASAGTSATSPVLPSSASSSSLGNPVLRQGYPEYLRSARITQVATMALPGLAGLIALTASGSVVGYRQANSGRSLRSGAERFLQ
jgi:hypothetical protein